MKSYPGCLYIVHGEECRLSVNITAGNILRMEVGASSVLLRSLLGD